MVRRITIRGTPITKKNSQKIIKVGGRWRIAQSTRYRDYETSACLQLINHRRDRIKRPVNVKCVYFMPTARRVDLLNLLSATCDILVKAQILEDDNSKIVVSHDGSRVKLDRRRPRVEIEITEAE